MSLRFRSRVFVAIAAILLISAAFAAGHGRPPTLAIVSFGADPGARSYARQIKRQFERHGAPAGQREWPALLRILAAKDPSYRD